jgi:hypothetical protein
MIKILVVLSLHCTVERLHLLWKGQNEYFYSEFLLGKDVIVP